MQEWQGQLLPHERIRWSGRPATGWLLSPSDWVVIPFSIFFFGFSVFWIVLAGSFGESAGGEPIANFWMFGIPFVLVGLFLMVGRFAVDAFLRTRTRYAVTDHRVLIARDGPFASFTALDLRGLPQLTLLPRADGRGTIRFGAPMPVMGRRNPGSIMPATDPVPQFLAIDKAQTVFDLIQREQRELAGN